MFQRVKRPIYRIAPMKTLIMLSGYAQSGKDTIGSHLVNTWGFRRLAFADKLKDEVSQRYGVKRELMDSGLGKRTQMMVDGSPTTVRDLLVQYGTARRRENSHYFIEPIIDTIDKAEANLVITDWRYENEYSRIRDRFNQQELRLIALRINRFKTPPFVSETEIQLDQFSFDVVLNNTGSVKALLRNVDKSLALPLVPVLIPQSKYSYHLC